MQDKEIIDESQLTNVVKTYDPRTQGAFPKYFAKLDKNINFMVKWDLGGKGKDQGGANAIDSISELASSELVNLFAGDDKSSQVYGIKNNPNEQPNNLKVGVKLFDNFIDLEKKLEKLTDQELEFIEVDTLNFERLDLTIEESEGYTKDIIQSLETNQEFELTEIDTSSFIEERPDLTIEEDEGYTKDSIDNGAINYIEKISSDIKKANYVSKINGFYDVVVASEMVANNDMGFHNLGVIETGDNKKIVTFDFGKSLDFYLGEEYSSISQHINYSELRSEIHAEVLLKEEFATSLDKAAEKSPKDIKKAIDKSLNKIKSHYKQYKPATLGIDGTILYYKLQGKSIVCDSNLEKIRDNFEKKPLDKQIKLIKDIYVERVLERRQECKDLATSIRFQIAVKDKNIDRAIEIIDQNPKLFQNGGPNLIHDKSFLQSHRLGNDIETVKRNNPELKNLISGELFEGYSSEKDLMSQKRIEAAIENVNKPSLISRMRDRFTKTENKVENNVVRNSIIKSQGEISL